MQATISEFNGFPCVATRHHKLLQNLTGFVKLAAIAICSK
jgi:hypothetical protein